MEINQVQKTATALAQLDPELQTIVLYVAQGILLARTTAAETAQQSAQK